MATVTSKATGNWSDGSTWDSDPAIPVNGDTVIVDAAHTVTFDVDQSGFANGVDLTINGVLDCSTDAGDYYLMASADIDGTGSLKAGSSGTALPMTVTFTIDFNSGAYGIEADNLTLELYCTNPTNEYVKLSGIEAAGQTELSVATDVTSDIWAVGDIVWVCDIDRDWEVQETTIAAGGIAAGAITVDDALAAGKIEGAYIVLAQRNIRLINTTDACIRDGSDGVVNAELYDCKYGAYNHNDLSFNGTCHLFTSFGIGYIVGGTIDGVITGSDAAGDYAIFNGAGLTISGAIIGSGKGPSFCYGCTCTAASLIAGCDTGLNSCSSCNALGTIEGCDYAIGTCNNVVISGTMLNGDNGIYFCNDIVCANATFTGNTKDINAGFYGRAYNTDFGGTTEFTIYDNVNRPKNKSFESYDHDQVVNAFKGWCKGGIVTSQTASPPTGYDRWYEHACEDTTQTNPVFRQFETTVEAGQAIEVDGKIRIADGEDLTGYAPALQIIDYYDDPLVDSTASPLDEDEIPEPNGGVEAGWQDVSVIWANQGDAPRLVIVRMIAWHDGGVDDVDIDECWSIADYKDQINTIHEKIKRLGPTGQS